MSKDKPVEKEQDDLLHCPNCDGIVVQNIFVVKKIPSVASETGQPGILPIPVGIVCMQCGYQYEEEEIKKQLQQGNAGSGLIHLPVSNKKIIS